MFEKKLKNNNIIYKRECILPKQFDGENNGRHRIDFLVEDKIIIEFKCARIIDKKAYYQIKRYLIVLNKKLGIIVNFREKFLKTRRVLNSDYKENS